MTKKEIYTEIVDIVDHLNELYDNLPEEDEHIICEVLGDVIGALKVVNFLIKRDVDL